MPSYVTPKRATDFVFYTSLVSRSDGTVFQSAPTLAAGDVKVSKDGGALANLTTLPTASGKLVTVSLSSTEMTADNVTVIFSDAAGNEWCDRTINIATSARQIDDLAYPATSGRSMVVDASGLVDANAVKVGPTGSGTAQTARDIGASVLLSSGTGTGQVKLSSGYVAPNWGDVGNPTTTVGLSGTTVKAVTDRVTANTDQWGGTAIASANVRANLTQILGTAPTEGGAGRLAGAFTTLFNVAAPVFTTASVNQTGDNFARLGAPAGASLSADVAAVKAVLPAALVGGRIDANMGAISADSNAADAFETMLDGTGGQTLFLGKLEINSTAAAGAIEVTNGSGPCIGLTGNNEGIKIDTFADAILLVNTPFTGNITGNLSGSVGSVTGNIGGNVVGSVASVTGNVGGNVTGSVGSVAAGGITASSIATDAIGADEISAAAVTKIQAGLSTLTTAQVNAEADTALADVGLTTTITGRIDAAVSSRSTPAQVASALTDIGLDHLVSVAVVGADVTDNSIVAKLASKSGTADWDSYSNATDSLEALRDRGDAAWATATGFSTHSAADVWAVATRTLTSAANITSTGGTTVPQTGDNFARLGAPAGASVSADIAAVHAKTTNLPNDPADASDIAAAFASVGLSLSANTAALSSILTAVDTEIASILAKVNLIPATIDGKTPEEWARIVAAVVAGRISGAGTGTETFKGLDEATTRVVVSVDDDGNRTDVVYS